jgi:hypothetical protein
MYCPKCSHQTASNNVRFCPGCGFSLGGVAELIANNGVFAAEEEKPPKPRRSMVKRGALLGATAMFISAFLILLASPHGVNKQRGLVIFTWAALMTFIGVFGYLKRVAAKIFSEEESSPSKKSASPRGPALPSAYSAPVVDSGQQIVDTSKMGQPSSVTEQTTSRLNNI